MPVLEAYQLEAAELMRLVADLGQPASEAVARVRAFAGASGFVVHGLWLDLELAGYRPPTAKPASVGDLLGLQKDHPLVRRIESYRLLVGYFMVRVHGGQPLRLPVSNLVADPVSEVEALLSRPGLAFAGPVPLENLPAGEIARQISQQVRSRGGDAIDSLFPRQQFAKLLSGLRSELLVFLSECVAGHRPD